MRRKIVAANWKMNGDKAEIQGLVEGFKQKLDTTAADVVVFPSSVFLPALEAGFADSKIEFGGQNAWTDPKGAFTGEISLGMLKEFGATYVLVGHSERRAIFGESDELIAAKTKAALEAGVTPMICIGETLEEREEGVTEKVVTGQLQAVIDVIGVDALAKTVVAYEPVWAIGTGKTASPEQAQEVHAAIRAFIAKQSAVVAEGLQILYGGSVKAASAAELFANPDVDGGLVGGASLLVEEFAGIVGAAK